MLCYKTGGGQSHRVEKDQPMSTQVHPVLLLEKRHYEITIMQQTVIMKVSITNCDKILFDNNKKIHIYIYKITMNLCLIRIYSMDLEKFGSL